MAQRELLGANWEEVLSDWYLGTVPPVSADEGWKALGAVERLWPEPIAEAAGDGTRGIAIIAPLVDLGLTLLACERLDGFDAVLARMKKGERSAAAEAYVLATLSQLAYSPVVEPLTEAGKRPDALIEVGDQRVYVEVTTPDDLSSTQLIASEMKNLSQRLLNENPGLSVNVYFLGQPSAEVTGAVCEMAARMASTGDGNIREIPGIAYIQIERHNGPGVPPALHLPHLPRLPVRAVSVSRVSEAPAGQSWHGMSTIRFPIIDQRARSLMHNERKHFDRQQSNLLILDVTAVPGGDCLWPDLMQRQFQPAVNQRFGAIALFQSGIGMRSIVRHWTIVPNQYAIRPIPQVLLDDLAGLSDPDFD